MKQIHTLCNDPNLPKEMKEELTAAHEDLSAVMQQKSNQLTDHVVSCFQSQYSKIGEKYVS